METGEFVRILGELVDTWREKEEYLNHTNEEIVMWRRRFLERNEEERLFIRVLFFACSTKNFMKQSPEQLLIDLQKGIKTDETK